MAHRTTSKRTTVQPYKDDKRFIRRSQTEKFTEKQSQVRRSLNRDRRRCASRTVPKGQGDRRDQRKVGMTNRNTLANL